jgi:hypothetical protein
MKNQADKGRTERVFQVGEKVYLKLQPYLQSSVHYRANHKLAFKFYGPFDILEKIGTVAYKLKLPPSSMIHPVIHVSQLKKCVPSDRVIDATLPPDPPDLQLPEKIVARRTRTLGSSSVKEGLIRWTGMPDTLATWENLQDLRRRFPGAPAWGQAGSQEEEDVMNLPSATRKKTLRDKEKEVEASGTEEQKVQVHRPTERQVQRSRLDHVKPSKEAEEAALSPAGAGSDPSMLSPGRVPPCTFAFGSLVTEELFPPPLASVPHPFSETPPLLILVSMNS